MKKLILMIIPVIIVLSGCNKRLLLGGGWYEYEPVEVELTGTLASPGETKIPGGGTEQYQLIKLDKPINIKEIEAGGKTKTVRRNVSWVQLVLTFVAVEFSSVSSKEKVWVRGTLFQTGSGGNDGPVQMRVQEIKSIK